MRGIDIPLGIDRHTVWPTSAIEVGEHPSGIDVQLSRREHGHSDDAVRTPIINVERLFIWRQHDAIWEGEIARDQLAHCPIGGKVKKLPLRVQHARSIGVGQIETACMVEIKVIQAVKILAADLIGNERYLE